MRATASKFEEKCLRLFVVVVVVMETDIVVMEMM